MFGRRTRLGARRRRRMGPRIARLFGGPRPRRRDRSGVDDPAKWRSRRSVRIATLVTGLFAAVFILGLCAAATVTAKQALIQWLPGVSIEVSLIAALLIAGTGATLGAVSALVELRRS